MTNHTDFKPNRVLKGVPTAGRFAAKDNAPGPALAAKPMVDDAFVEDYLASQPRYAGTTAEMVEAITGRLNETRNFSDEHLEQVADEVWLQNRGVTPAEESGFGAAMDRVRAADPQAWETISAYLKAKEDFAEGSTFAPPEPPMGMEAAPGPGTARGSGAVKAVPDGITEPVSSLDPRFQNGEVFDRIVIRGQEFRRAGSEDVSPWDTQAIRLQASRPLSEMEAYKLAGVVGFANRKALGGESLSAPGAAPERDSPFSFISPIDTAKGRRSDFAMFEDLIPDIVANGSEVRSTDRSGPGTRGTRLIEPFTEPDLKVSIYYAV